MNMSKPLHYNHNRIILGRRRPQYNLLIGIGQGPPFRNPHWALQQITDTGVANATQIHRLSSSKSSCEKIPPRNASSCKTQTSCAPVPLGKHKNTSKTPQENECTGLSHGCPFSLMASSKLSRYESPARDIV